MILLAVPAVGLALVSIAAFFGRWSWFLDVIATVRPQLTVVLVVATLLLLAGKWRKTALVTGAAAVVNLVVIVPLFMGPSPTVPPEAPLRILSFNLLAANDQFGDVVAYIRDIDADVVFLHEASRPWEVAIESSDLPYEVTKSRSDDLIFGTLVLSRTGDQVTSFGFPTTGARAVEVLHDGTAILGIHPLAPVTAERASLRDGQFGFAQEWANDQTGPHIVTGDFNATPWSYPFRRLIAGTDLSNSQAGYGLELSFPSTGFFGFRIPIDHLLYSPEFVVTDRTLGPPLGSDHFPLVVELWNPG